MMKITVASTLVGLAAAECSGTPCQMLSVSTPSRLDSGTEMEADPELGVNTFTAVDKCATSEVKDLTSWVLSYYQDVSNSLDVSFSNILTTARLANSALRYLGALSSELQSYSRMSNITTELNAMLRTCMADAMHLSASMQRCDMSFTHDNFGVDSVTTQGSEGTDSVWISPTVTNTEGTCLASLCEHTQAWHQTCGENGFLADLDRVATSHDIAGTQYAFAGNRETSLAQPVTNLYTQLNDAATYAQLNEDQFVQESALLRRTSLWLEIQFHGMMVMVRRSLAGGQFAQQEDLETCAHVGYPLEVVEWLSLAIQKCEGSMVRTFLKVTPMNSKYMHKLVDAMEDKIKNVIKKGSPGVLFSGKISNLCVGFQDLEQDILAEIKNLQEADAAMTDGSGDPKKLNTLFLSGISKMGTADKEAFTQKSGPTQTYGMAAQYLVPPKSFQDQ